jgi:antitoxin (DNA-binding transcriptional repressor) of toxin-antitoxin stability system
MIDVMATIHIPEAEAARDFAALMARVRAGAEVMIEGTESPAILLRAAEERPLRLLSESLRIAKTHGSRITLDDAFGRDLEAVIDSHPESLENPWG